MPNRRLPLLLTSLLAATAGLQAKPPLASVELRLTTPLTSYSSKPGSGFESVVVSSRNDKGRIFLPPGTIVRGEVRKRKSVGWGIRHERASLELEFEEYQLPNGDRFPFEADLHALDNARESVAPDGTIKGVLAARTPHTFLQGAWHRPSIELFQKSFIGLTGASGKIFTSMSLGPIGAAAIFGVRVALFRMAEPEIQLAPGTEMRINVMSVPTDAPWFDPPADLPLDEEVAGALRDRAADIHRADGKLERDIINVAFMGTRQELITAFEAAGWNQADHWNLKTVRTGFMAYNRQAGYPTAPISKLYYQQTDADLVFQKSLDTMSKRHHVRFWHTEIQGEEIWLGAATHDVGVTFGEGGFTHKIHPKIDYERGKIIADIAFAGCSEGAAYVDRPDLKRDWQDGSGIITDGRLAVVPLRGYCSSRDDFAVSAGILKKDPKSGASGLARRLILEGRNYVLRSNPYYLVYDAWRWHRSERGRTAAMLAE
ncbi:MAG TPA: LssY C-terminal domain-containing protein [Bryobacteraceae bacterium]